MKLPLHIIGDPKIPVDWTARGKNEITTQKGQPIFSAVLFS